MGHSIEDHSIMAQQDVYFQFPIRALNMGKKIDEVTEEEALIRWAEICHYCLVDYGKVNFAKAGEDHGYEIARWYSESKDCETSCNPGIRKNAEVLFAAERLKVRLHSDPAVSIKAHRIIQDLSGGNMHVRLRWDIFWDITGMGWRDWTILCGIYAMLGNRTKVQLCYKQINALSLGFNGVTQIGSKLKELTLTPRQTQITTDKLKRRNLFSKFSINGRHNWYSHKPQAELEKMVIDSEVHKRKRRLDTKASEATARGKAEVLRRLKALDRESAKAELAQLKNKPSQVGKA
jgi:hypothetical protein